jgi:exosortase
LVHRGRAHGPIILATALWLFWRAREWLAGNARPLKGGLWWLVLVPLLLLYVFARAYGILFVETGTLYLILVLLALVHWGKAAVRHLWFPLLYMAFLIVPPGSLVTEATQPLKIWISAAAADSLYALGYPVAQLGAIIHIDQYQLLVEQACAGLGSLLTLSALGLLYIHLRGPTRAWHSGALMAAIIPIAIFANFVRVVALVLLTYHVGNEFAQGFAHEAAGMFMFLVSMLCMFAADAAIRTMAGRNGGRAT